MQHSTVNESPRAVHFGPFLDNLQEELSSKQSFCRFPPPDPDDALTAGRATGMGVRSGRQPRSRGKDGGGEKPR